MGLHWVRPPPIITLNKIPLLYSGCENYMLIISSGEKNDLSYHILEGVLHWEAGVKILVPADTEKLCDFGVII